MDIKTFLTLIAQVLAVTATFLGNPGAAASILNAWQYEILPLL